jgi:ATP-dependent HslUV protease ATP-binding subunit HslU
VYQFQQKRQKRNPEGPFFLGNPMIGAVISTVVNCALACAVSAALPAGRGCWQRAMAGGWCARARVLTAVPVPLPQVLTVATAPVAALLGGNVRQVGAMMVIVLVGLRNVYLK